MSYEEFLGQYTSASERYAEAFYGIIMVTGCTGMVSLGVPKADADVAFMLWTALFVNILWGVIDGVTVVYGTMVDEVASDVAVGKLRSGQAEAKDDVLAGLDDSLVGKLSDADKDKVAEVIAASSEYEKFRNKVGWQEIKRILAILSIDFVTVFPVAIPFIFFTDVTTAVRWSFVIATVLMAFLGYRWAKYARMQRWKIAIFFSSFTVFLLAISFLLGGI
jgi:VIT1/CCC1 family predicted Fe2+/Mn2+ transporter